MILSGKDIEYKMGGDIFIDPFNEKQINRNSYNLRLDGELLVYQQRIPDMVRTLLQKIIIPSEVLLLEPGKLYLGKTLEYTETKDFENK